MQQYSITMQYAVMNETEIKSKQYDQL